MSTITIVFLALAAWALIGLAYHQYRSKKNQKV
jgi:hypothetical protein